MLPFLRKKQDTGISTMLVQDRKPDNDNAEQDTNSEGLKMVAEDLCKALESKDYSKIADALRAAFQILDSEPHEEGPHIDESEQE